MAPSVLHVLDHRLKQIPPVRDPVQRCMHYCGFPSGITGWGKWTADDHVALIQQLQYAVGTGELVLRADPTPRKAFISACTNLRAILVLLKKREITELELSILHNAAKQFGSNLKRCLVGLPIREAAKFNIDRPKVHALLHFRFACKLYATY